MIYGKRRKRIIFCVFQEEEDETEEDINNYDIETQKYLVDKKLAMFFFNCSIPFKVVENKYFLDLVDSLCALKFKYKPPCRQTLGDGILNEVHKDIECEKKELLKGTDSVLLVDGWRNKNVNRKFLVFSLRNSDVNQAYLTFNDTSLEREDGQSLAENIERAIELAKVKYETNVYAIVSDNDSKIVCGSRLAQTSSGDKLLQSTCSSHSANLLMKSFVDDDFIDKLRNIIHAFREPKTSSLLHRLRGTSLKNFPDTRFCYVRDTCVSVVQNLPKLREIFLIEDVESLDKIADDIFSTEFENKLQDIIKNLDPICKLINKCQDPYFNIADSTEAWLSLKLPTHEFDELIRIRIKKAIWPVAYAANFLHHKYQGKLLDENQKNIVNSFFQEHLDQQSFQDLQLFITQRADLSRSAEKCISPIAFWRLLRFRYPNLVNFAIKLMQIPASTALLEGLFSQWTYVHNVYRNRLLNEKSSYLLDIYHSLRYLNIRTRVSNQKSKNKKSKRKHVRID